MNVRSFHSHLLRKSFYANFHLFPSFISHFHTFSKLHIAFPKLQGIPFKTARVLVFSLRHPQIATLLIYLQSYKRASSSVLILFLFGKVIDSNYLPCFSHVLLLFCICILISGFIIIQHTLNIILLKAGICTKWPC